MYIIQNFFRIIYKILFNIQIEKLYLKNFFLVPDDWEEECTSGSEYTPGIEDPSDEISDSNISDDSMFEQPKKKKKKKNLSLSSDLNEFCNESSNKSHFRDKEKSLGQNVKLIELGDSDDSSDENSFSSSSSSDESISIESDSQMGKKSDLQINCDEASLNLVTSNGKLN